jgi:crotonobetainyl-CoA:carnitine CoA-transferase CaiB-like acyl-CoA transferase
MRLYRAVDRPELAEDDEYIDPIRRQAHGDEIDGIVAEWICARTLDDVMRVFEAAEVAAAPVYDAQQLLADEHLRARGTFLAVEDPDLGRMTVQAPVALLSETPGRVDHLGRGVGADNDAVYGDLLGLDAARRDALRDAGII